MKKTLALILALAMVFSTVTVAFAEEAVVEEAAEVVEEEVVEAVVSEEAAALATIGMLQGTGDGVTAEYEAEEMTRLIAASALLKLKGLYEEAIEYDGVDNFADVEDYVWAQGKNLMAYLKANPALGFGGDEKGNFNPSANIDEQSYYKVLLETLGYKQNVGEVVGDFAWAETLEFAEKVGLKPAGVEKFTVGNLAKATVSALKAKTKDGKVYIDTLVEAGKVDGDLAVAAGLMEEAKAVEVAVKSVKAIGNTVVEIEFEEAIDAAAAENLDNYSIDGLEIKSAMLDGTKKVLLETEAQTSGKTYTLVVGDVKVNFGGAAKVSGAPELKKATGTDTERVELEFDKVLDTVSALDIENYAIKDVEVVSAKLNSARKVVTLTTEGMKAGKSYTVKVTNIKSVDGVALKTASKSFYSKSDKSAPKIDSLTVKTNTRLFLVFNEYVDHESALDVANYSIKAGSTELEIEAITVEDNDDTDKTEVEITTASQKSGTRYELSVINVADTSVLGNKIERPVKKTFTGKAVDKNAPTVGTPKVISRNMVKVAFNEASRLDWATALDVSNYTFNYDVTVENVEKIPGANADSTTVLITVSDLGDKSTYKLTIENVADEYGNIMKKVDKTVNYNKAGLGSARISQIYSKSSTEIVVVYDKEVDPISAKDVANYTINGDIGTPISAKINDEITEVTLKTNEQVEGKEYKVTINGVKDLAGNVLNTSSKFIAKVTENDTEAPEIEDVFAVSRNIIRITFSEPIDIKVAKDEEAQAKVGDNLYNYAVSYDDGKVLEFSGPTRLGDNECELVSLTGIQDKAGNEFDQGAYDEDPLSFWGSGDDADRIEFSYEQINIEKYRFTFDQKVEPAAGAPGTFADDDDDDNGYDTVWDWTYKVASGKKAIDEKDINTYFESPHAPYLKIENLDSKDKTTIWADLEDEDAPYIVNVYAKDRKTIKVEYSEDLKSKGGYSLYYYDNAGKKRNVSIAAEINGDDANIVDITPSSDLESRFEYVLVVTGEARDLAGNRSEHKDDEFTFLGSDLAKPGNYVKGVTITNGRTFEINFASAYTGNIVVETVYGSDDDKVVIGDVNMAAVKDGLISLTNGFVLSSEYTYAVKDSDDNTLFEFDGIVEEATVVIDGTKVEISYDDMKDGDKVYVIEGRDKLNDVLPGSIPVGENDVKAGVIKTSITLNAEITVIVMRGSVPYYYNFLITE